MSLYDTREIGKVKIVMLKGTDGANSYNAGAGINLVGNTFVNAQRGARCGIIDSITSGYAHTTILLSGNESIKAGEVFILKSETSGTIDHLRIQYRTSASNVYDYWLYDTDGTTQKSIEIDDDMLLFITLDETGYKAIIIDAVSSSDSLAGLGIGKMTSYTNEVVDTDIDLHRAPVIGDRILLYCNSAVSNPTSLKTYNDGVAVSSNVDMILPLNYVKGWNILEYKNQIGERWTLKQSIKALPYTAGIGIGINDTTITNTNPQLGTDCAYKKFDSSISSGNLGFINGYAKNLVLDFRVDATPDENNGYTFTLQSGTTSVINKNAVLKDRDGNLFMQDIYSGMILYCESNVSGAGTQANPVVVTVLSIDNWYVQRGCATGTEPGYCATVEGQANEGTGERAHVEGYQNEASGSSSHAEGWGNTAEGDNSHAEGQGNTASGTASHAENYGNTASGHYSHAQGYQSTASGNSASASGISTTASGDAAFTSNSYNIASGTNSTAMGDGTRASGAAAFSGGEGTRAGYANQTALGQYNSNKSGNLFEIGNGSDDDNRSNALEVKSNGDLTASGTITDGEGNDLASVASLEVSASGNPIIVNAVDVAAKELSVALEPIQDLHGYSYPWAGGAGKNKLLTPDIATFKSLNTGGTWSGNAYTIYGVTYTLNTDSDGNITSIKVNGTASANADLLFTPNTRKTLDNYGLVVGSSYIFTSGLTSDVSGVIMMLNGSASNIEANASGRTFTVNSTDTYAINIRVYNGTTANNLLLKPMIRLATVTDSTFSPYTNICPISGRTGTTVSTRNEDNTETASATISFGTTVYGGQVDFKTGRVRVTHGYKLGSELSWNFNESYKIGYADISGKAFGRTNIISNAYKTVSKHYSEMVNGELSGVAFTSEINICNTSCATLSAFQTAIANTQLCYDLATPTELTLTPNNLTLLKGYNYITADGQIDLTYVPESISGYAESILVPISLLGTNETGRTTASRAYTSGEYFYKDQKMYKATTSIASGATFTAGTNCQQTTLFAELKAAQN